MTHSKSKEDLERRNPEPMTREELERYTLHRRFDRMGRLVGDANMERLMKAHVMVLGLGGVGSWAAEALARSGVGALTLVDFDAVCITNFNRQVQALEGSLGCKKVHLAAERLRAINPELKIRVHEKFYDATSCDEILGAATAGGAPDSSFFVIDAIDNITAKCHLLSTCRARGFRVVCSTGSGGRLDPTRIRVRDLAETRLDPLADALRRILRRKHAFPRKGLFGIPAVYSEEQPTQPLELTYDRGKGFRCVCSTKENPFFNCDNRHQIMGNAGFVTGAFGFACASVAVKALLE